MWIWNEREQRYDHVENGRVVGYSYEPPFRNVLGQQVVRQEIPVVSSVPRTTFTAPARGFESQAAANGWTGLLSGARAPQFAAPRGSNIPPEVFSGRGVAPDELSRFVGPAGGGVPADYRRTLNPWQYNPSSVQRVNTPYVWDPRGYWAPPSSSTYRPGGNDLGYDVGKAVVPKYNPKTGKVEGENDYAVQDYAGLLKDPNASRYLQPMDILGNERLQTLAASRGIPVRDRYGNYTDAYEQLGKGVAYHTLDLIDKAAGTGGATPTVGQLRDGMNDIVDSFDRTVLGGAGQGAGPDNQGVAGPASGGPGNEPMATPGSQGLDPQRTVGGGSEW